MSNDLAVNTPKASLTLNFGGILSAVAPRPTVALRLGFLLSANAPKATAAFTALVGEVCYLAAVAPSAMASFESTPENIILSATTKPVTTSFHTVSGDLLQFAATVSVPHASFSAWTDSDMAFSATAPVVRFKATAYQTAENAPTDPPYSVIFMNTETYAVSERTNWPFTSITEFNGKVYLSGPTGLYRIGGDTDNGVSIDAVVRPGLQNFGTDNYKRLLRLYATFEGDGISAQVIGDNGYMGTVHNVNSAPGDTGLHAQRIKLDRGPKSQNWTVEIRNINGGKLKLNKISLLAEETNRKPT